MKKFYTIALAATAATCAWGSTTVSSDITTATTWTTSGSPYILDTTIYVKNDAVLTIEPGVIVRGQPISATKNPGSLVVTQAGTIIADGDPNNPIIFTSAVIDVDGDNVADLDGTYFARFTGAEAFLDDDPSASPLGPVDGNGDSNESYWGGLVILGEAPTNVGTADKAATDNPTPALHHIEGLTKNNDTVYGGHKFNDNSGVLRYVSVRHGGEEIGTGNEINGITLGGVGAGTTIEYCEVYCNFDDGFEFFGGTVNTNHLVVTYAGDDQFDGDQGWTGINQYWFATLPYFVIGSKNGDKGFEFDGDDGLTVTEHLTDQSGNFINFADYTVYNATIIGADAATGNAVSTNGQINLKANFGGSIYTSYFFEAGVPAIDSVSASTGAHLVQNTFVSTATDFVTNVNTALSSSLVSTNDGNVVSGGGFGAPLLVGSDQAWGGTATLNPRIGFAFSGVLNSVIEQQGAESNDYRGAFDPDTNVELWTTGWTVLNTKGVLVD